MFKVKALMWLPVVLGWLVRTLVCEDLLWLRCKNGNSVFQHPGWAGQWTLVSD